MDALSRLLTLNAPQGSIDRKLPVRRRLAVAALRWRLSLIRWHTYAGEAQLEMPTGDAMTYAGKVLILPQTLPTVCASHSGTDTYRVR